MDSWDFKIGGYRDGKLRMETVHRGVSSMEMEVSTFETRMARGDFDRVVISDLRLAWVRAQHGEGPWAKDLSRVITPTKRTRRG